jgi:hypothetical protein
MMPHTDEIARQVAVMHDKYPKETTSQIAARLMLSPLFIINALDEGERLGLFKRGKDKKGALTDKLVEAAPIDYKNLTGGELGLENARLQQEILRVITSANADEMDIEAGTLDVWCRGIKPTEVELALYMLEKVEIITSYEIADPKDKKSKYKFYTLWINAKHQWGIKQFKKK